MTFGEYTQVATATTPALIVYLIDISRSMTLPLGNKRRIDVVRDALAVTLRRMVFLSTRGSRISPRYHVAVLAYSTNVYDLIGGIQSIDRLANLDVPQFQTDTLTDTAMGFRRVLEVLQANLSRYANSPAPLICHLTDGEFNGEDPSPIVKQIRSLRVNDGSVLVENIFINDKVMISGGIGDLRTWQGITTATRFTDDNIGKYAALLRNMSSPLPTSYHSVMNEQGYRISPSAIMMLPGTDMSLIEMGFVMSSSTRVR